MSQDITKELPMSDSEKLDHVFTISRNVIAGLNQLDARLTNVENDLASLKAGTNPFWQVMHDQQQQTLAMLQEHTAILQEHSGRMDRIETHLQQQDERFAQWDEQMDIRFRKLTDKFEVLQEDTLEWRADVRALKRRIIQLEPVN